MALSLFQTITTSVSPDGLNTKACAEWATQVMEVGGAAALSKTCKTRWAQGDSYEFRSFDTHHRVQTFAFYPIKCVTSN